MPKFVTFGSLEPAAIFIARGTEWVKIPFVLTYAATGKRFNAFELAATDAGPDEHVYIAFFDEATLVRHESGACVPKLAELFGSN